MDSTENNQEVQEDVLFDRAQEGTAEEAANNILNMWNSEEQPTNEETEAAPEESEVEEETTEKDEDETEEVSTEETEEEPTEEVEEVDEGEEVSEEETVDSSYTIKVDGEEYEVNLEELKAGYQRQSDYTRKSQALAEGRKQNEAIQDERIKLEQERQMYANGLEMLREQQEAKLTAFDEVDWNGLKEEDPYTYMIKKDEYRDAQDKIANAEQQQKIVHQQQAQSQMAARSAYVQNEYAKLVEVLPEWAKEGSTVKTDVRDYASKAGFLPEEVEQLSDHRSVLILKKAMEFDRLTQKVSPKKKAVKKVPKVQKSGRGKVKAEAASEVDQKKRARLRKSGNTDDAASVFYDLL